MYMFTILLLYHAFEQWTQTTAKADGNIISLANIQSWAKVLDNLDNSDLVLFAPLHLLGSYS